MSSTLSASRGPGAAARWRPARGTCIGAASVCCCLLAWQALSSSGLISSVVLPGPFGLVGRAVYLAGPHNDPPFQLEHDIGLTMLRLLGGFALAVLLAIPLGIAAALSKPAARLLVPVLTVLMAVPALALVPILMLLTGLGDTTDVTVVVITAFVPIAVYVRDGVRLVDARYFWTARSFGAGPADILRHILLPALAVPLVAGFRMGMGYAWRSLIATESLTALTGGLGYTIFQASQFFDTTEIYLYMVVIAVLGFGIETAFRAAERRTAVRWGVLATTGQR